LRQFLDQVFADERRVPARAAGGDDDAVNAAQLRRRHVQAAELGRRAFKIQPAAQRVQHRLRLLENLLEHEVRVFAARRVFLRKFQVADLHVGRVRAEIGHVKAFRRDGGHVVVVQINDFFRVRHDGVGVAGEKIFVLADADDERRAAPRADDRVSGKSAQMTARP
jgi:hypothetical protein